MTMLETPLELIPEVKKVQINHHVSIDGSQTLTMDFQNVGFYVSTLQYKHSGEAAQQINLRDATDEFIIDLIKQLAKSLKNKVVM